jgi:hypothetical protein
VDNDLGISTWGDEQEDFIEASRVKAFVGFPPERHLQEGDVFFIVDGSKLNKRYKPIPWRKAESLHLLRPWDESRELARTEIKENFYLLTASKISKDDKKDRNALLKRVSKIFRTTGPLSRKR